jgi:nitrate reductase NapAB chaperone NapD
LIAPGSWHAYTPQPQICALVVHVGTALLNDVLPWLASLGGVGYLFDAAENQPRQGALVVEADADQADRMRTAIGSLMRIADTETPAAML